MSESPKLTKKQIAILREAVTDIREGCLSSEWSRLMSEDLMENLDVLDQAGMLAVDIIDSHHAWAPTPRGVRYVECLERADD